ncbi:MAG: pyruvate kinase [Campylobacterota bacterium]|nr:pyruvate kinase [Campylobacterota bacterium]
MESKITENIYNELIELKSKILDCVNEVDEVDENEQNQSLQNLQAYIKLRSQDISELQNSLTSIGLSSLGRAQSCVINSINQDIFILSKLLHKEYNETQNDQNALNYEDAKKIMLKNSEVFGESSTKFKTKVMVTLPSEASDDENLIGDIISKGASVVRINTAHDNAAVWNKMAAKVKEENKKQNKETKIYVDLAGPKNRTQNIEKIFTPFKIGSWRDPKEVEIVPLSKENALTSKGEKDSLGNRVSTLVVSDDFFEACKTSKELTIDDLEREKTQNYTIINKDERVFIDANKKITIFENTTVEIDDFHEDEPIMSKLYNYELLPQEIRLFKSQKIIITHKNIMGQADFKYQDELYAGIVGCTNKAIFPYVKKDDEIFIDDGKIGCKVVDIIDLGLVCEVLIAKENGTILKEEKGINFPSTDLAIDAITNEDKKNFEDIVEFADIIGLSFAQTKDDILMLQNMLKEKGKNKTAIAPKIETKTALRNLPDILETLIKWDNYALMIARGDLAIEVGFDNLPYIQEEILGICEAAHVPVIYATQILEGKMKNNLPSRAEVTDAATAQRADCVMLNKGPYVTDTVVILKNILRQMHTVFQKNRQLFSTCKAWEIV